MFTTERLHEIFINTDQINSERMDAIEKRISVLETQLELIIKLLRNDSNA